MRARAQHIVLVFKFDKWNPKVSWFQMFPNTRSRNSIHIEQESETKQRIGACHLKYAIFFMYFLISVLFSTIFFIVFSWRLIFLFFILKRNRSNNPVPVTWRQTRFVWVRIVQANTGNYYLRISINSSGKMTSTTAVSSSVLQYHISNFICLPKEHLPHCNRWHFEHCANHFWKCF